jgi:sugar phosphate permease
VDAVDSEKRRADGYRGGRLAGGGAYLAAICLMLTVSWLSDKFQNRKLFIWPLLLIAAIAFFGSWMIGNQAFWLSYGLLVIAAACMYAPYGPFFALIPELLPRNVSGVSMGLINSFGALGASWRLAGGVSQWHHGRAWRVVHLYGHCAAGIGGADVQRAGQRRSNGCADDDKKLAG